MFIVSVHFIVSFSQFHRAYMRGGLSGRKSASHICGEHFPVENRPRIYAERTFRLKTGLAYMRGAFAGPIRDPAYMRGAFSCLGRLRVGLRVGVGAVFLLLVSCCGRGRGTPGGG